MVAVCLMPDKLQVPQVAGTTVGNTRGRSNKTAELHFDRLGQPPDALTVSRRVSNLLVIKDLQKTQLMAHPVH